METDKLVVHMALQTFLKEKFCKHREKFTHKETLQS
jgi:hypothetical protein